jgi:outer membrane protein TolC
VTLSGAAGFSATRAGDLFDASQLLWSLGLSAAQVLFDGGAIHARVEQAEAARDQTVATYRQTVLAAFEDVENQLVQSRTLAEQEAFRRQASEAADETERLALNQYRAGQISYTDVVTAQASALSARRTLAQLLLSRQTTAVALIQAMGGGWTAPD